MRGQRSILEQWRQAAENQTDPPTVITQQPRQPIHIVAPFQETMEVLPPRMLYCATDGACRANGSRNATGGYSAIFEDHPELSIAEPLFPMNGHPVTNNRCEYMGLLRAIEQAPPATPLHVYSDSMLLINTFNKWMANWRKNGWRKYDGGVVLNLDLVQRLDTMRSRRPAPIILEHVRAHTNKKDRISTLNNHADYWAKKAAAQGRAQVVDVNISV
jgi:ribonuclease HI